MLHNDVFFSELYIRSFSIKQLNQKKNLHRNNIFKSGVVLEALDTELSQHGLMVPIDLGNSKLFGPRRFGDATDAMKGSVRFCGLCGLLQIIQKEAIRGGVTKRRGPIILG